nr:hypothetical protein [Nostoc sp. ChiSLP03a]
MNLTPLPLKGRGWGLGLYSMQLGSAIFKIFIVSVPTDIATGMTDVATETTNVTTETTNVTTETTDVATGTTNVTTETTDVAIVAVSYYGNWLNST